tara:strand:+ start:1343 stop:1846 length:504 start_codon:yes stop_codon:yes gene_type:complete
MKLNVKSLITAAALLASALLAQAQSVYSGSLSAGTTLLFAYPVAISSVSVAGTAAGATTVTLFDNSTTATTYTNAAYTTALTYATNITSIITNSAGNQQTNTFTGYYTTTATTAANTNTFPSVAAYTAGASLVNGPNVVGFNTVRGLAVTATTNATITVTYRRLTVP